jgi:hypothetical protein
VQHGHRGVIGGVHFFALAPLDGVPASAGASPATLKKLGDYFNPNPMLAYDPLDSAGADVVRLERACTAHVFRLDGNGSTSGPIQSGYDGVSRIGKRQLTEAWYGAGVWTIDFSGQSSSTDGVRDDGRRTWGNTLCWSFMPGADTLSAKGYKGAIYAATCSEGSTSIASRTAPLSGARRRSG